MLASLRHKLTVVSTSLGGLLCAVCFVASLVTLTIGLKTCLWWLELVTPLLFTIWLLLYGRVGYLRQRKASFLRRERRRREHPAETLEIPADVKKPEQYSGGKPLHEAQWSFIGLAVEAQGNYFVNGILAAVLPPLALFLLSLQLMALPEGGGWAVGLILSEALALSLLVYFALTNREPTAEWIKNRVRTELFRREQYLLLGGVGPYLKMSSPQGAAEALKRRGEIESADDQSLIGLVPLQERSGLTWLEALHSATAGTIPDRSDPIDRMESYLYYRIGKQSLWFANELRDCTENERLWSRLLTGALLFAILVAAIHAFLLSRGGEAALAPDYFAVVVGTLGIVLPPLGTACLGIRAMYNFRGRTRIYGHERNRLRSQKGPLEALILEARNLPASGTGRTLHDIDFEFRAIVLRTEHSLSIEMEQWMLLMERQDHEVSP